MTDTDASAWKRIAELIRFLLVGGVSTLVYFGLYSSIVLAGVPFALAALGAFVSSAAVGFLLHDRWTFRTNAASPFGFARWLTLQGAVLGTNIGLLVLLINGAKLNRIIAQLVLLPLIPLATFALSRRFVFKRPSTEPGFTPSR